MNAQIFHYNNWLREIDPTILQERLLTILEKSGFWVLATTDHHFDPIGYTCLWLLGESHLAIHTFPEEGCTYLELSSCNAHMHQKFVDELLQTFEVHAQREIEEFGPKLKSRTI